MKINNVIEVKAVSKNFLLPHEKVSSLKGLFTGWYKKRSRTSETQHALKDISFEIKEGEFFGIVGRNGSGKSTMLKLLASIYQPSKGSVKVSGRLVPFIELGVGFNPELTGRENVYLNGALLGFSNKEMRAMYDDIVSFAELERFMDQKLKNYSSGMQVRLAFSVAIMADADILLIDEVLAVGDADFQRKCFEYFQSLKKHKKTVVFVTHDMNAVREYCDRAILIDKSRLVYEGPADKVAEQYTRLFTEVEESEEVSAAVNEQKRWGNGHAKITVISTDKQSYNAGDEFVTIKTECVARRDLENPIIGLLVKDAADNQLLGTNTQIKKLRLGIIKKDTPVRLEWKIPNIFADGKYYIDTSIELNDAVTVCDWWTEAATFAVHKTERTAYLITPLITVDRQPE